MSFIKKIKKKSGVYLAEVESYRDGKRVRTRFIRYIGKEGSLRAGVTTTSPAATTSEDVGNKQGSSLRTEDVGNKQASTLFTTPPTAIEGAADVGNKGQPPRQLELPSPLTV